VCSGAGQGGEQLEARDSRRWLCAHQVAERRLADADALGRGGGRPPSSLLLSPCLQCCAVVIARSTSPLLGLLGGWLLLLLLLLLLHLLEPEHVCA